MGLSILKKALSHFGDFAGDWAKKKEETTFTENASKTKKQQRN